MQHHVSLRVLHNHLGAVSLRQRPDSALVGIVDPGRTEIDNTAALDGRAPSLSAHAIPRLEHDAREPSLEDLVRGRQTGQTGANDDYVGRLLSSREGQRARRLLDNGKSGIDLNEPVRVRQLGDRHQRHGGPVASQELLDGLCVATVGGIVVDDVDVELHNVGDGAAGRDDELAEVQEGQMNLGVVVGGGGPVLCGADLSGDVHRLGAGGGDDGRAVVQARRVGKVDNLCLCHWGGGRGWCSRVKMVNETGASR